MYLHNLSLCRKLKTQKPLCRKVKTQKDCQVEAIWSFPRQPLNQVISRSDKLWCMNQLIEMAKPNKANDITDPCTKGMDLAWNLGVRRLEVQVNSKCVVWSGCLQIRRLTLISTQI